MSHAKYSPSKLEKLEACPCFVQQEFETNDAAREGTLLHEACEKKDLDLCETDAQMDLVEICLDYVNLLATGIENVIIHDELKLQIHDPWTKELLTYGTADKVIVDPAARNGHVVDYKFGRVAVSNAAVNFQGQCYVTGAFQAFPDVDTFTVHFVCPRQDVISTHTYQRGDLDTILTRIRDVIGKCNDPCKVECENEIACGYCARSPVCPVKQNTAMMVAQRIGLPLPETFGPGGWVSPSDRALALVLANSLSDWCEKVKKHTNKVAIEEGIEIPGYSLRSRAGGTTVQEVANAIDKIKNVFPDISEDAIYEACSMSLPKLVGQVHAHLSQGTKKITKKKVDEDVRNLLDECCVTGHEVVFLQRNRGINDEDIIKQIQSSREVGN